MLPAFLTLWFLVKIPLLCVLTARYTSQWSALPTWVYPLGTLLTLWWDPVINTAPPFLGLEPQRTEHRGDKLLCPQLFNLSNYILKAWLTWGQIGFELSLELNISCKMSCVLLNEASHHLNAPRQRRRSQPVLSQVLLSSSPIREVTPTPLGEESEGMGPETEEVCKWTANPSTWNRKAVREDGLSPSLFKRGSPASCSMPYLYHISWWLAWVGIYSKCSLKEHFL